MHDIVKVEAMQQTPAPRREFGRDFTQGIQVSKDNGDEFWINVKRADAADLLQLEFPSLDIGSTMQIEVIENDDLDYAFDPITSERITVL